MMDIGNEKTLRFTAGQRQLLRAMARSADGSIVAGDVGVMAANDVPSLIRRGLVEQRGAQLHLTVRGGEIAASRFGGRPGGAANTSEQPTAADAEPPSASSAQETEPAAQRAPAASEEAITAQPTPPTSDAPPTPPAFDASRAAAPDVIPTSSMVAATTPTTPTGKIGTIHSLLAVSGGASMAELMAATGWLAHSVRAGLSALRKSGARIERSQDDRGTCYQLAHHS